MLACMHEHTVGAERQDEEQQQVISTDSVPFPTEKLVGLDQIHITVLGNKCLFENRAVSKKAFCNTRNLELYSLADDIVGQVKTGTTGNTATQNVI